MPERDQWEAIADRMLRPIANIEELTGKEVFAIMTRRVWDGLGKAKSLTKKDRDS